MIQRRLERTAPAIHAMLDGPASPDYGRQRQHVHESPDVVSNERGEGDSEQGLEGDVGGLTAHRRPSAHGEAV